MARRILYLSYFYSPDLGAGSFRNTALSQALSKKLNSDDLVDIMTTLPNRYNMENLSAEEFEQIDQIRIHRWKVPKHGNGFIRQIISFLAYRKQVLNKIGDQKYDLVFASSSKLFTAYLAYCIAKKRGLKLYVDLRDLFSENLVELIKFPILGRVVSFFVRHFFERPVMNFATHINVNSEGFLNSVTTSSSAHVSFFPNGIDDFFLGHLQDPNLANKPRIICYAGNIGEGQGLEKIIPMLANKLGSNFLFKVIGEGSTKHKLQEEVTRLGLLNVEILPPVPRYELLQYYCHAHYLFVHLNDFKSFRKVLPSKLFEYACFNIPIVAGVSGYAKDFIEQHIKDNVFVFDPCDVNSAAEYFLNSDYYLLARPNFVDRFKRTHISENMADSIIQYLPPMA
ncbi:MAG TPA: glycosyltransferase family 4 protein [Saprospiraceae bacterium]|nr:glycosyltransferase family 4 protein [Saprospiraceae bacterium]